MPNCRCESLTDRASDWVSGPLAVFGCCGSFKANQELKVELAVRDKTVSALRSEIDVLNKEYTELSEQMLKDEEARLFFFDAVSAFPLNCRSTQLICCSTIVIGATAQRISTVGASLPSALAGIQCRACLDEARRSCARRNAPAPAPTQADASVAVAGTPPCCIALLCRRSARTS
jgi:hypothetical protein